MTVQIIPTAESGILAPLFLTVNQRLASVVLPAAMETPAAAMPSIEVLTTVAPIAMPIAPIESPEVWVKGGPEDRAIDRPVDGMKNGAINWLIHRAINRNRWRAIGGRGISRRWINGRWSINRWRASRNIGRGGCVHRSRPIINGTRSINRGGHHHWQTKIEAKRHPYPRVGG